MLKHGPYGCWCKFEIFTWYTISGFILSMQSLVNCCYHPVWVSMCLCYYFTLRWRNNGHDSVSNHQPRDCFLNRLFRHRSKKTSKLRVTGLCVRNSPGTGEFPAQMASNAENVSIWWRHHEYTLNTSCLYHCFYHLNYQHCFGHYIGLA